MLPDLPDTHDIRHLQGALGFVRRFRTAVDAGAHRGIWTRRLCAAFEQVFAFEPTDRARLIAAPAVVHRVALGAGPARAALADGPHNTGQTHLVPGDAVEVRALDSFALADVDFLKVDVEGYELRVLEGAARILAVDRPVVLIEENGLCARYGIEPGAAGAYLVGRGYRLAARYNKDEVYAWQG